MYSFVSGPQCLLLVLLLFGHVYMFALFTPRLDHTLYLGLFIPSFFTLFTSLGYLCPACTILYIWGYIFGTASKGAFLPSGTLNVSSCGMKARHEASLLTATRKLGNISPFNPPPFSPLYTPEWRVCPSLCWYNLVYRSFPSYICLN